MLDLYAAVDIGTTWIKAQVISQCSKSKVYRARRCDVQTPEQLMSAAQEDLIQNLTSRPLELLKQAVNELVSDNSELGRLHLIQSCYWPGTIIVPKESPVKALMMHDLRASANKFASDWSYRLSPILDWITHEYPETKVDVRSSGSSLTHLLSGRNVVDHLTASGWNESYQRVDGGAVSLPELVTSGDLIETVNSSEFPGIAEICTYGNIPDTAATILESSDLLGKGDYLFYLGSFGMLIELKVDPTPHRVRQAHSMQELYKFIDFCPQDGQWAETLGLTKPLQEEQLKLRPSASRNIVTTAPLGEFSMQREINVSSNVTWQEYSLNRLTSLSKVPRGSRVLVTGGGAQAFYPGDYKFDELTVYVRPSNELGALRMFSRLR